MLAVTADGQGRSFSMLLGLVLPLAESNFFNLLWLNGGERKKAGCVQERGAKWVGVCF